MPLEGHWERVNTPLRSTTRREGRALIAVGAALAVLLVVTLVLSLRGGSSATRSGCINLTVPSTMGGATLHACGREAERWCRSDGPRQEALARQLRARCRQAGYP